MKRYISLACIALVIVTCMVSPVSASSFDDSTYFNVLDYSFPNNSDGTLIHYNGSPISFDLPYSAYFYVDAVVRTNSPALNAYAVIPNVSDIRSLNVVYLGQMDGYSNFYRIYGNIHGYATSALYFDFNLTQSDYIEFLSLHTSTFNINAFDSECYCSIATVDYDRTIHYIPGDEINYRSFVGTSEPYLSSYRLDLYNLDWRKYDYIDYYLYICVDSINSVSCTMGGADVPFSLSYLDNNEAAMNDYIFSVRVDCRELDRTSSDYPLVVINGNVILDSANLISVTSCVGVIVQNIDSEATLIRRIINTINNGFNLLNSWISNQTLSIANSLGSNFNYLHTWLDSYTSQIVNAIRGDTTPGNSFQQQVNQKDQQLNNMADVMESVDQPDLNSVNVSANSYVDGTVLAASMSGITSVFSQGLFFNIILMSIMMATAGYVLFGKR